MELVEKNIETELLNMVHKLNNVDSNMKLIRKDM